MSSVKQEYEKNYQQLNWAIFINVILTLAQVVGGVLSGSLSLIADALHNLGDAGAILIAVIARKISKKPSNHNMTYGYERSKIIGVLINSASLIIIGIYLVIEAFNKYFNPTPIDGWVVFWIALFALVIDIITAFITYKSGAKDHIDIKAAFIHNISDALASVAVIITSVFIILYKIYIFDVIATVGISAYVIYHGISLLKKAILIIMQGVPEHLNIEDIKLKIEEISEIDKVFHIHVWQLDDQKVYFEGHLVVNHTDYENIKEKVRVLLQNKFSITHSTLEIHSSKYAT